VAVTVVLSCWGKRTAPLNPLDGFEGHFEAAEKEGKGRTGGERKGKKGTEETEETPFEINF